MESKDKYEFQGIGLGTADRRKVEQQFNDYRNSYHIDSLSDLSILEELVYREYLQDRYKQQVNKVNKSKTVNKENIIPKHILDALNENLEQILTLKERLGLFQEKKDDDYKAFEILEKKFGIWKDEHVEERKVTCPFCSEIFFLNIRTSAYIPSKLKLYKNKILCNKYLWQCYQENKITKIDMASILNVSEDYIDWLKEKIYNQEKNA